MLFCYLANNVSYVVKQCFHYIYHNDEYTSYKESNFTIILHMQANFKYQYYIT